MDSRSQPCGEASADAEVFAGLGPCVICGATGYSLSLGGPGICPACDCGHFNAAALAHHNAKLAAGLKAIRASPWLPIASAPRDGTHILACDDTASFGWADGKPLPPVQTVVHWYEFGDESGFYTSVNELEPQRTFPATHWKPLDAPSPAENSAHSPSEASASALPPDEPSGDPS